MLYSVGYVVRKNSKETSINKGSCFDLGYRNAIHHFWSNRLINVLNGKKPRINNVIELIVWRNNYVFASQYK